MKKYGFIFIIISAGLLLLVCQGCQEKNETKLSPKEAAPDMEHSKEEDGEEKPVRIGVTLAADSASYQIKLAEYMEEEAKEAGQDIELEILYGNWDAGEQTSHMNTFILEKKDAIILCPINAKSMLTSLKQAKEAGIPVINLNMKVDSVSTQYISTYVGASMSEEAVLAAEMVREILGETGGRIALIEGAPGSDPQIYRTETFMDEMASWPLIEIVGMGSGDWDRDKAYRVACDLLRKNKELDVIYAHDSNMAMGAVRAVEEAGRSDSVKIIGIGEGEEYVRAVEQGELYGFIMQNAEYEAVTALDCAVWAAKGEALLPWYKNPVKKITMENIEDEK